MPDDLTQQHLSQMKNLLASVHQFLEHGEELVDHVFAHPDDDQGVRNAIAFLEAVRDFSSEDVMVIRKRSTSVRNGLMAAVYAADPRVPVNEISASAGVTDSFVSRMAHRYGAEKRTDRARPSQQASGS